MFLLRSPDTIAMIFQGITLNSTMFLLRFVSAILSSSLHKTLNSTMFLLRFKGNAADFKRKPSKFHYVSIKIQRQCWMTLSLIFSLNSTMFLLRCCTCYCLPIYLTNSKFHYVSIKISFMSFNINNYSSLNSTMFLLRSSTLRPRIRINQL